jgi:hypothetical protein
MHLQEYIFNLQVKVQGICASHNTSGNLYETIQSTLSAIKHYPLSDHTAFSIRCIWPALETITERETCADLEITLLHRNIMKVNCEAWAWLQNTCRNRVLNVLRGTSEGVSWMDCLVKSVDNFVLERQPLRIFRPEDYLSFLGDPMEI